MVNLRLEPHFRRLRQPAAHGSVRARGCDGGRRRGGVTHRPPRYEPRAWTERAAPRRHVVGRGRTVRKKARGRDETRRDEPPPARQVTATSTDLERILGRKRDLGAQTARTSTRASSAVVHRQNSTSTVRIPLYKAVLFFWLLSPHTSPHALRPCALVLAHLRRTSTVNNPPSYGDPSGPDIIASHTKMFESSFGPH